VVERTCRPPNEEPLARLVQVVVRERHDIITELRSAGEGLGGALGPPLPFRRRGLFATAESVLCLRG
jgi:hypothetical protein